MRDVKYKKIINLTVFVLIGILWGCEYDQPGSLFDADDQGKPAPVISSIEPPDLALAGVGEIVITGSNFSSVMHENVVYFGEKSAHIYEVSTTELRVRPPNLTNESLKVRVAVTGAISFSNAIEYSLLPAVQTLGVFRDNENPYAMAVDAQENIFVGVFNVNTSRTAGIYKITPDLEVSNYGQANHTREYTSLRLGADGYLYSVQGRLRVIARVPPGGGAEENWLTTLPAGVSLVDIDFDEYGYLWAVGDNQNIFRIQMSDRSFTAYPFAADIRAVRYYGGHVYLAGRQGSGPRNIWRLAVGSGDITGQPEVYFAFSEAYRSDAEALGLAFAADGTLYIGTDSEDVIIVVYPDKSWEPLYPGLFQPVGSVMHWGSDSHMYVANLKTAPARNSILKINTLKSGAPYYGAQ
jgi:hypothetical protein